MSNEPPVPPDSDAGDATYLEKTLRHEPTDLLLDDAVNREELRAVWRGSVKAAIGTFAVFALIWLAGNAFGRSRFDEESSVLLIVGAFLGVFMFIIRWLMFLGGEKQEAISEWCTLLAGNGEAADSVYSHIAGRLRERQLPVHQYVEKRTPMDFRATSNRLVLVDGYHFVYVSVFAYGTSLYLGWSMWRVRKGNVLIQQYFNRSTGNHLDPIGRILNLERLKAMREAVHAVCREALHTAVANVSVPQSYGFPSGLPAIENLPNANVPRFGSPQTWGQAPSQP